MPRNGVGVYSKPAGTTAVSGTTIESGDYNATIDDLVVDANTARPVTAGGTGATTAAQARINLGIPPDLVYPTVPDMVADVALTDGSYVGTLGYADPGDDGGWFYEVMTLAAFGSTPDGKGDHLAANGLVLKLVRGGTFVAERYGALNGEVSANLQAAWDDMIAFQTASGSSETPVEFSYSGRGTLKDQVQMVNATGGRVSNVTNKVEASLLTAVAGGNLSSTTPMLLCRFTGGTHDFGQLDGGKFAACYDFNAIGGARINYPKARRFKGIGIRFRGQCNRAVVTAPIVQEYLAVDAEYNTQANYTAKGISIETGDFDINDANVVTTGTCIELSGSGSGVFIVAPHIYNGNPNAPGSGGAILPFTNMPLVVNRSTGRNNITNGYLDDGQVDDYTGTLRLIDSPVTLNDQAIVTLPVVRLYPQEVGQTQIAEKTIEDLRGEGTVGFVNTGGFTWAGAVDVCDKYFTEMALKNTTVSVAKTRYNVYPANDPDIEVHIKTQGNFEINYDSGNTILTMAVKPANSVFEFTGAVKPLVTTVASLPAAATAGAGAKAFVTNATATTFASVVAGGGANGVPVYSDGTNWRIG